MILFPRKSGQHKKLDSSADDIKAAGEKTVSSIKQAFRVDPGVGREHGITEVKSSDLPKGDDNAYVKLRELRAEARYAGMREKRAKLKAEAEDSKKK